MHAGRRLLASVLQPVIQVERHFGARLLGPRKTSPFSVTEAEDREPAGLLRTVVAVCCCLFGEVARRMESLRICCSARRGRV